jgi:hypothetical protein
MTQLLRTPRAVVAQADNGAVRITRRDAEDLLLMREADAAASQRGVALAVRLSRAYAMASGDMLAAIDTTFPWAAILSDRDRQTMAKELDRLLWASSELGHFTTLVNTIASWRGTAEALADGLTPDEDTSLANDFTLPDIPRPTR